MRAALIIAGSLAVLAVSVVAAGYFWLRTGVRESDRTVELDGLNAPVQIIYDEYGIPHIFAASEDDAFFALGYAHAADRLVQMEMQRRIAAGRLAEVVGERALGLDRYMRTLGIYRLAEASIPQLSDGLRAQIQNYAAGVNAWLETHDGALPPELVVLRHTPEPWQPADSIVWGRLISLQLEGDFRDEMLRARVARQLSAAEIDLGELDTLFPDRDWTPATLARRQAESDGLRLAADLLNAIPTVGSHGASNQWVVSGNQTATQWPILANDPHLGLRAPILWYLARIDTPTLKLAGATTPGVPLMVLGHNGSIAWAMTNNGADVQDVFIERIDPENSDRYLTPEGSQTFTTREEVIAVAGSDDETLVVRSTRHGPVISDVIEEMDAVVEEDHVLALAYTALAEGDLNSEAVYRLNRARSWSEFRAALALWRGPIQNVGYADTSGNIGLAVPGTLPIRRSGDGNGPVPGWTGDHDWTGIVESRELPSIRNPQAGRLVNANNPVVGPDYPYDLGPGGDEPYRARRIIELLDAMPSLTVEGASAMQMDAVSPAAQDLLPLMLVIRAESPRSADALAMLRRWDHSMDADRAEPLIYAAWLRALGRALYADELGEVFDDYWGTRPAVVRTMLSEATHWCDNVGTDAAETCQDVLESAFEAALTELSDAYGDDPSTWRWGDAHLAPLRNPALSRLPVIADLFDIGTETGGWQFTVQRAASRISDEESPYANTHGAGYRAVYDLSDLDNSRFIIATGQSGHPLSPHYSDLVNLWRDGLFLPLAGSPADVAARGTGVTMMTPMQ